MTQAGTRPAVYASGSNEYSITGGPSGVGFFNAPVHALLTGGEYIETDSAESGRQIAWAGGIFILRQDAHAGDQWDRGENVVGTNWIISEGGALGWELFPPQPCLLRNRL